MNEPLLGELRVDVERKRRHEGAGADNPKSGHRRSDIGHRRADVGDLRALIVANRAVVLQLDRCAVGNPLDVGDEVRHHDLEVRDERHVRACARHVHRIYTGCENGLLPQRPAHAQVTLGTHDHRRAREHLAPFASHEVRERDEHSVLFGDVTRETLPAVHARRARRAVLLKPRSSRGRSREQKNQLRAVERGDRSSHTSSAARPHDVSKARTSLPRSTKRSSSNMP